MVNYCQGVVSPCHLSVVSSAPQLLLIVTRILEFMCDGLRSPSFKRNDLSNKLLYRASRCAVPS